MQGESKSLVTSFDMCAQVCVVTATGIRRRMIKKTSLPIHLALLCTLLAKRITYQLYNGVAFVICWPHSNIKQ